MFGGREASWGRSYCFGGVGVVLVGIGIALTTRGAISRPRVEPLPLREWGTVTAPVAGSSETGAFAGAELFAGPGKLGNNYFAGVLPNGRIVKPAGVSVQIGMNPLGEALTPDGRFLITSNDDERNPGLTSLRDAVNHGGYSLSVLDTASMKVVSQINLAGTFFLGMQVTGNGPYTVWASGGASQDMKLFRLSPDGLIAAADTPAVKIEPITPADQGFVSHYTPGEVFRNPDSRGERPSTPTGFSSRTGAKITFPAGSALSPDGRFLYVACNGDNSVAVIDTAKRAVVRQVSAGYFPYGVSVGRDGKTVLVANWGVTEYRFRHPTYDRATGTLEKIEPTGQNQADGFYVAPTSTSGKAPRTSSVSVLEAPSGDGAQLRPLGAVYQGHKLDAYLRVGDTHPCASAIVGGKDQEVLYVAKANSDAIGLIDLHSREHGRPGKRLEDLDLSPVHLTAADGHPVHGAYPNAITVAPDQQRAYVAEAGLNTVAVLDTSDARRPRLLGRIPTGWYPTGVTVSPDGKSLYVINAKGIGEDINPKTVVPAERRLTGVESFSDSNFVFGTAQKIDLTAPLPSHEEVLRQSFGTQSSVDTSIVPTGGGPSRKIKHVFFILQENKSFDAMLGSVDHFGPFASTSYHRQNGAPVTNKQYAAVSPNTQLLARTFAAAVNYYSDSEESDAGHQFCASGTCTDFSEKTLLVKTGRGMLVNKNFDVEDYPESGYIFNNAARNGVSFKDYGDMVRITGTDTGASSPPVRNDPPSGKAGYPTALSPTLENVGDTDSPTSGLGQSYFMSLPILKVIGDRNANGEPRLDRDYPGYNFNISDQRRAKEFIRDFDRMVRENTLPQLVWIYLPNDHTGPVQAKNVPFPTAAQQVADGDVALGMVVQHIMQSPVYFDPASGEGSALFLSYDDAQSCLDHIHPHRTPLTLISPYARPGYLGKKHYSSASIVKTEELLLGMPPNNLGDLFATDLRDMFQPNYNGIRPRTLPFSRTVAYQASPEGRRIWKLASRLDTDEPDDDSRRLGALARLSMRADDLAAAAHRKPSRSHRAYAKEQDYLYATALQVVGAPRPRDDDD